MSATVVPHPSARVPIKVLVRNIAGAIRQGAAERNLTIEAFATELLRDVGYEDEVAMMMFRAVAWIAAEDERNGGGPLI